METISLSQTDAASLLGVKQPTLSEATSEGYKVDGYPVRAWANFDASGRVSSYDVPLRVADRQNPATGEEVMDELRSQQPQQASRESGNSVPDPMRYSHVLAGRTIGDAVAETAHGVSANAGGTVVASQFIGLLGQNPGLADYLLDIGVPLALAGIGTYATEPGEDWRTAKIGGLSIGGWATIKLVRGLFSQNTGHERSPPEQRESTLGGGAGQSKGVGDRSEQRRLPEGNQGGRTRGGRVSSVVRTSETR